MRIDSSTFFLLSFLTILLSLNFCGIAYSAATDATSASFDRLLAAQTQTHRNPSPDRGSQRRSFNQVQEI